ncbi:MAG: BamA/TamA family outer membrane protein [Bacteroidetes bacterium]|nr:BamA/TamA family outer membrane protein [Bacteroidota bacterium]
MKSCFLSITAIFIFSQDLFSQQQKSDSSRLPFAIADEKRLSDEDLRDKKEGAYITGTPDFSSDPVNGFGYGAEGSLYFNGTRSDPFFNYTAYRAKLDFVVFNTTKEQREFFVKLDVPYIFNSKWRLRVEGGYEANPNLLFFGLTPKESLQGLTYYPANPSTGLPDSTNAPVTNAHWSDYEKNGLVGPNEFYHNYFKKEGVLNVSIERSFFGDKVGTLIGFELAQLNYTTFAGNSLLRSQSEAGLVKGVKNNFITIAQFGLAYDTRDLEPDPGSGLFLELTDEVSLKSLGSSYNFNKIYAHANWYQTILPSLFPKLIFAARLGMGYISGDAPFFEYQDQWSQEGDIEGLGGARTLRGYKISRFVGRLMEFNNFELRWRFAKAKMFNQQFAFSAVPFYDVGGVYDNLASFDFTQMRYSQGVGLRIAWNVNTILRFDYAWSKEDAQFFFNLAHTF